VPSKEFLRGASIQRAMITDWLERIGYPGLAARMYAEIDQVAAVDPLDMTKEKKSEDRTE
jgi:hypothetical protein